MYERPSPPSCAIGQVESIVPVVSNKRVVGDVLPSAKTLGSGFGTVDATCETKIVELTRCKCGSTDRTIEIAGEWIYLASIAAPDTQG